MGAIPFASFANSPEPLALILRELGRPGFATFLAVSAVIALPTVLLGFLQVLFVAFYQMFAKTTGQ